MRRAAAVLILAVWGLGAAAFAEDGPRIVAVTPEVLGDRIVCRLQTAGVPGGKQVQSMRSGLVSSVELTLGLVDDRDELVGGRSVSLRMAFDLWEEIFSVTADGRERRFQSLDDLRAYLADLEGLVVGPAGLLEPGGRYRIRARLVVHAIAPDEQRRVADVIAGEQRPKREGQDQQEASVSLGKLIRLFYKGGGDGENGLERLSGWFKPPEVGFEAH